MNQSLVKISSILFHSFAAFVLMQSEGVGQRGFPLLALACFPKPHFFKRGIFPCYLTFILNKYLSPDGEVLHCICVLTFFIQKPRAIFIVLQLK